MDFRSLLSTFQAATGDETQSPIDDKNAERVPLIELTEKLWRLTELKRSTNTMVAAPTKQAPTRENVHIAICLCIVDELPHEEIWKHWIESTANTSTPTSKSTRNSTTSTTETKATQVDSTTPQSQQQQQISAELYIHAKHPERIQSKWTKNKLIPISYKPNWNDVRIVRAMLKLAEIAIGNPNTTHVLFGTESCLPICSLETMLQDDEFTSCRISVLTCLGQNECTRFDEHHVWNVLEQSIPTRAIYKALPGWCCLCRHHMEKVLELPARHLQGQDLWPAFENCWAPEEAYFGTCLALLGLLQECNTARSLTFAEWVHDAKNHKDRAHPKTWDEDFDASLVQYLRKEGCFFLRKVKHPMSLSKWQQAVNGNDHSNGSISTKGQEHFGQKRKAPQDDQGRHGDNYYARQRRRHSPPRDHYRGSHDDSRYSRPYSSRSEPRRYRP